MSKSSTTILWVPGAWHGPEHFDLAARKLQDAGYQTATVQLKSVGAYPPLDSFWPDVEQIREGIKHAVDAGQNVVVVAHSYGGVPTSQAIKGFDQKSRESAGLEGSVTRLFYCASFVIPEGASLSTAFGPGGGELPWYDINAERTEVNPIDPDKVFYNDMPEDLVQRCVSSLKPHSYQTLHSKLEWAAWKHGVPTTYLYAKQDQAIPIDLQHMMVEEFAKGYHIDTEEVDASHSPFWSKVDETVAAIRRAAGEAI